MQEQPTYSNLVGHWGLDRDLTFLNHGSYGACPLEILECQQRYRAQMERDPVRFMVVDAERQLDESREAAASFLNCDAGDLVFVRNATIGLCTILNSIDWAEGDQVLVNDHEYPSLRNELERMRERVGLVPVVAKVPFPIEREEDVVEALLAAVTPRTRLCVVSHITSPTGTVFPVQRIVDELKARGVETFVDGAHAAGQVPLDLTALGAAYYTGTFHKWVLAPKGVAFLHVPRERQASVRPLALSSRAADERPERSKILCDFDYMGTDDYTAALCVKDALRIVPEIAGCDWAGIMERNRALALKGRTIVCEAIGATPPTPDSMIGALASILLPARPDGLPGAATYEEPLQDELVERYRIQVPVWQVEDLGRRMTRISAQLYNDESQYRYYGRALREVLEAEIASAPTTTLPSGP